MNRSKIVLSLLLVLIAGGVNAQTVKLATGEWDPYTSSSRAGKGFFTEVVDGALKAAGITYTLEFVPWKRAEEMLKAGQVAAVFPYTETAERKENFVFSSAVANSTGRFFYLKTKFPSGLNWKSYSDLRSYTIASGSGYWFEKPFQEAGLKLETASEELSGYRKVSIGRVDLVAGDELVGWESIKQAGLKPELFGVAANPLNESTLHLMGLKGSAGSEKFLTAFNAAFAKFKESPQYQALLKKYNLQ